MPGFAHVCIAMGLSVFLYKVTGGKFSIKHAIIFSVNNLVGPDIFGVLDYLSPWYFFFHGYGWVIAAIPLVFLWMIFARYHVQWKPFKAWKRDPKVEPVITIPEIYCLVAAGGIMHMFVDIIGHPSFIYYNGVLVPWGTAWFGDQLFESIQGIWATGLFPCGNTFHFWENYVLLGSILLVALILIIFIMQKGKKPFYLSVLVIIVSYFIPLAISWFIPNSGFNINQPGIVNYYGDPTGFVPYTFHLTGGEADLGVLVFFGLFLFVPLVLLYMSYTGIPGIKLKGYRAIAAQVESENHREIDEKIKSRLANQSAANE